ncbi:MAG: S8 family serine peptidase, partial [Actinobacteria bacterium]|nr:S8 family serine peptidase [Actinomycetota bacterium]
DGVRVGVAPGVERVLIGKVLGPAGGSTEMLFNAIEWALRQRADVISMSLGIDFPGMVARLLGTGLPVEVATSRALHAYRSNLRLFDRLATVIEAHAVRGRGALMVAAAGNESRRDRQPPLTVDVTPPAAADGFISVGAVGPGGPGEFPFAVAPFSNSGCQVSAPGVGIRSAALESGLIRLSGTSMAVPHVVGVLALWIQRQFPEGTRPQNWTADVRRELERHLIPAPRRMRGDYGLGVVQAPR